MFNWILTFDEEEKDTETTAKAVDRLIKMYNLSSGKTFMWDSPSAINTLTSFKPGAIISINKWENKSNDPT